MADQAEQGQDQDSPIITVDGVIANLSPSLENDCSHRLSEDSTTLPRVNRHDFLAEIRRQEEEEMNIHEANTNDRIAHASNSNPMASALDLQGWRELVANNNRIMQQQSDLISHFLCEKRFETPCYEGTGNMRPRMEAPVSTPEISGSTRDINKSSTEIPLTRNSDRSGLDDLIAHVSTDKGNETEDCLQSADTEDVLQSLKDFHDSADKTGPNIDQKLAELVMENFHDRVDEEKAKALAKDYDKPANCNQCYVPKLNDVVWFTLDKYAQNTDVKLQRIQHYQLKSMFPVLQLFDKLYQSTKAKKGLTHSETVEGLNLAKDAFQLMQVAFTDVSFRRRQFLKDKLRAPYKQLCSDSNPVTKNLLGDKVEEKMKELEVAKRMSGKLRHSEFRSFQTNMDHQKSRPPQRFNARGYAPQHHQRNFGRVHPHENCDELFIGTMKPFKGVSRDTVRRWIKTVMKNAGVDIQVFKPHSTRAASTSAAKQAGVQISDIMKCAGWTNAQTFSRFYDKIVSQQSNSSSNFSRSLLETV
ncbi:hypothetical protein FSP39_012863 [Pinctada imbricata]|uniref:Tyr recombinase domain-containing protein n=1 Tax=Pinctada imbricata TaxID=66713 RepID=A0AA88XZX3_PINIB|nr:hypothetical protein FSP39_012863 [Pinctada imbricata]